MSSEIEYIEPTQEHVGQMVEVRDNDGQDWRKRKLLGVISHRLRFITEPEFDGIPLPWRYARIPRPLTYAERQAKCGLKVGDRVRFARLWGPGEFGYEMLTDTVIPEYLGKIGVIQVMEADNIGRGGCVHVSGIPYVLPFFVLKKVEERYATHKDIGKTVYVYGVPDDVFEIENIYATDNWRAVVVKGDKRFVYELSNLRVKE